MASKQQFYQAGLTLMVTLSIPALCLFPLLVTSPALAQNQNARQAEAIRLVRLGNEQKVRGHFHAAMQSYQQAIALFQAVGDRPGQAGTLRNLGDFYVLLGQFARAVETYQQSLTIARQINHLPSQISVLLNLGNTYSYQAKFPLAMETYRQALVIARPINSPELASIWIAMGNDYLTMTDLPKAIEAYQQGLPLARQSGDFENQVTALGGLGNAYNSLDEYTKALPFYQQALEIARQQNDREGQLIVLGNLGISYRSLAQYAQAIQLHQQVLEMARQMKSTRRQAESLDNLGSDYQQQGEYRRSVHFYQQALALYRQIDDRYGQTTALGNLAIAYSAMGEYPQAILLQQQALELSKAMDDRSGIAASQQNLSGVYSDLGLYQDAIQLAQQGLAIWQKLGNRLGQSGALTALGNAYYGLQQYQKAIQWHQQALDTARKVGSRRNIALALINLGNVYEAQGQHQQAVQSQQQALDLARQTGDRQAEANALGNLGISYWSLEQYAQSVQVLEQQLKITRETGDRQGESRSLANFGRTLLLWKKYPEAETLLRQSIQVRESLRQGLSDREKVAIFETQTNPYINLQVALVAQNKPEAALEIAERGRARAFAELLAARTSGTESKGSASLANLTPPSIEQIKQVARTQKATLVEYSMTNDERLLIWVIQPNGTIIARSAKLTGLNRSVDALVANNRAAMGVRSRGRTGGLGPEATPRPSQDQQSQQLYQLLIQPIADLLPVDPNASVIFLPQGSLFLVPFPALQDASGKLLIETHTILTAPSIQVLQLTQQQTVRGRGKTWLPALIVGNPTMPKVRIQVGGALVQLPNLQGAEQEAAAISTLLKTPFLTGKQANKAVVLQQISQAHLVHLATHGLLDDFKGLGVPGAIALAPAGSDNGLLTSDEILKLKLKADLVVLSACNTGQGRITGDGVIGLSRAFISAGVPSVMVTLWSIDDDSTAFLMQQFYTHLQQNPNKAQVLRQAMLDTKQRYPHPSQWAAFTLIGAAQ